MLYEKLREYAASGVYPMHMPGHKRNAAALPPGLPYELDITEIYGFDDLHDPHGFLEETAGLAAKLYGSVRAFLLINGSTVGILAAIGALTTRGDKILIAGNCHRSVTNAVSLFGLTPVMLTPDTDAASGVACSVDPSSVKSALAKDNGIKLVVVTSPSYEGVISDIDSIARAAHSLDIPLLADSAHGAHLGFSSAFPASAVQAGADVVVMSLHKTLPALTQCSLLHVCGERANVSEIKRLLSVLQTSSPSYVLMASIDQCLGLLSSEKGRLFKEYERNLTLFEKRILPLKNLRVLCRGTQGAGSAVPSRGNNRNVPLCSAFYDFDPGKLVIVTKNTAISGVLLADILRSDYNIEIERACADHAIAMTSICDTAEGFVRLSDALLAIDSSLG